jgi:hypothetical protein
MILLGLCSREEIESSITYKTQDYHRVSTQLYSVGLTQYNKQGVRIWIVARITIGFA